MCLIAVAWRAHPEWPLVVAANRDEFHARPAAAAAPWPEHPDVFGGRDLRQGGGWLGVSVRDRFAAVTNVRRMVPPELGAPSRGRLVSGFLGGTDPAATFAARLDAEAGHYAGFNLLLQSGGEFRFVSNQSGFRDETLAPGLHLVSNATLDTPWPKSRRLRATLEAYLAAAPGTAEPLLAALADDTPAPPQDLPETGVGPRLEAALSPPFVRAGAYGTRCSTVILRRSDGQTAFIERRYDADGRRTGDTRRTLSLPPLAAA